jgi:hypothetical protein
MIAVAGFWELGYNVPIIEADLWNFPLLDFGVDEWNMSPITGIAGFTVKEWADAEQMLDTMRFEYTLVFVTEKGEEELSSFTHPENACYVFGKATFSPFLGMKKENDLSVRLDTLNNKGLLWPHQCLVSVLHHRRSQWP